MRAARRALSDGQQQEAAQAVLAHLRAHERYRRAKCVMAYMACRGELSLEPVIADVLAAGKTLLLPRCEAEGVMTARRIAHMGQLETGAYGLMEPSRDCCVTPPEEIDLILVPGTAFDRMGGRVGQGRGYYDRFLAQSCAWRIGVCHAFALLENVPSQAHDARMDELMTPGGIIRAKNINDDRRT